MRTSLFFRSSSRPASPASRPESAVGLQSSDAVEPLSLPPPVNTARSGPLARLALSPFRASSPSPAGPPRSSASVSTISTPGPSPGLNASSFSVSYLDSVGLKFSEAVAQIFNPPAGAGPHHHHPSLTSRTVPNAGSPVKDVDVLLRGEKPLPAGRGRTLGSLITQELNDAATVRQDQNLYRAIINVLQRPLSTLLGGLSHRVTALILASDFPPTSPLLNLNPTQIHALAFANFASELLETFDRHHLGAKPTDGLRPIKEGLEGVVQKVIPPFLAVLRADVGSALSEMENSGVSKAPGASCSSGIEQLEKTLVRVGSLATRLTSTVPQITPPPTPASGQPQTLVQSIQLQSMLASFDIHIVWRCLVALGYRQFYLPMIAPSQTSPRTAPATAPSPSTPPMSSLDNLPPMARSSSTGKLKNRSSLGGMSMLSASSTSSSNGGEYSGLPPYVTPPDTPMVQPVRTDSPTKQEKAGHGLGLSLGLTSFKASAAGKNPVSAVAPSPVVLPSAPSKPITPPSSGLLSVAKLPSVQTLLSGRSTPSGDSSLSHGLAHATSFGKLKGGHAKAASSPPVASSPADACQTALTTLLKDIHVVSALLKRVFPRPAPGGVAREAVDEALEKFEAFASVVTHLVQNPFYVVHGEKGAKVDVDIGKLMEVTFQAPFLIVLPVLLRLCVLSSGSISSPQALAANPDQASVSFFLNLSIDEYRRGCLSGFGKADECAGIVGGALLRVLDGVTGSGANISAVHKRWFKEWITKTVEAIEDESDSEDDEADCPLQA